MQDRGKLGITEIVRNGEQGKRAVAHPTIV